MPLGDFLFCHRTKCLINISWMTAQTRVVIRLRLGENYFQILVDVYLAVCGNGVMIFWLVLFAYSFAYFAFLFVLFPLLLMVFK